MALSSALLSQSEKELMIKRGLTLETTITGEHVNLSTNELGKGKYGKSCIQFVESTREYIAGSAMPYWQFTRHLHTLTCFHFA